MTEKPLISIIIPVFNTPEKYLERLFACVRRQMCHDFECVIIDDGSYAKTAEFLDRFDFGGSNVQIVHTENSGVSGARNKGIAKATGDYLAFADADDFFSSDFVASGIKYVREYHPDIICGVIVYEPPINGELQSGTIPELLQGNDLTEAKKSLLNITPRKKAYRILGSPCGKLYHKSILQNVGFPEGVTNFEDQIFNRLAFEKASSVLVVPDIWYTYFQNEFSAMHGAFSNDFCRKQKDYWDLCAKLDQDENEEIRKGLRRNYIHEYGSIIKENRLRAYAGFKELSADFSVLAAHPVMKDAVSNLSVWNRSLTKKQKLHLALLKMKAYPVFALEQLLLNGRKNTEN